MERMLRVNQFKPKAVVIDPVTNFASLGSEAEVKAMLTRLIDFFKMRRITALFTSLTAGGSFMEATQVGVSSLMDTWILLQDVQLGAERNRALYLLKSRGMAHSNQVREFLLTDHGVDLLDVYAGPSGDLLVGSARGALEAREKAQAVVRAQDAERRRRELVHKRQALEAQISALRAEFEVEHAFAARTIAQEETRTRELGGDRLQMARLRQADPATPGKTRRRNS